METINFFRKGMEIDVSDRYKSNETYSFAQNMFIREHGGSIENEAGTVLCTEINGTILGSVKVGDIYILALWRDGFAVFVEYNPITCVWKDIRSYLCLNWYKHTKVSFIHKVFNGCEDLLYFTDDENNYMCLNLSRLNEYTGDQCEELSINKWVSLSSIETIVSKQNNSGSLKLGKYVIYRRLGDFMKNTTNWDIVDEVNITQNVSDNVYTEQGGFNQINNPDEAGSYPMTSSSILIKSNYIDYYYKYIQYAIMAYNTNDGSYSNIYISDYLQLNFTDSGAKSEWIYNGTNHAGTITLNDLVVDKRHVGIVKAHELIDNRLFLSNIRNYDRLEYDWAYIQERVSKRLNIFWINKAYPKTEKKYVKTYMRDEVYAFGIQG